MDGLWTEAALLCKLRRAGFIVSKKSVLEPTPTIVFVGKEVDGLRRRVLNAPNALAQCLSFLLRGVVKGSMPWGRLRSLRGRLQWVARLKCFLQPFMAGAYRQIQAGHDFFPRRLLRALATVFVFACLPFSCPPPPPPRTAGCALRRCLFF